MGILTLILAVEVDLLLLCSGILTNSMSCLRDDWLGLCVSLLSSSNYYL